jgi:hypothetical protein
MLSGFAARQSDNLIAGGLKVFRHCTADIPGRAGKKDSHISFLA